MTSNLGSDKWRAGTKSEEVASEIMEIVRQTFRPEFINRLDQIVLFESLTPAMMEQIVAIQLKRVQQRLAKQDIKLEVKSTAQKLLAKQGYDPVYGARPLKRLIQEKILDPLALLMVEGQVKDGDQVQVAVEKNRLKLSH